MTNNQYKISRTETKYLFGGSGNSGRSDVGGGQVVVVEKVVSSGVT